MSASSHPGLKFAKAKPKVIDKRAAEREQDARERKAKAAVRWRDGRFCVVCRWRKASEVHEALKFRSLGGEVTTENSIYVCAGASGGVCHQLLGYHRIAVEGKDCNKRLTFRMHATTAKEVRPLPSDERRKIVIERD